MKYHSTELESKKQHTSLHVVFEPSCWFRICSALLCDVSIQFLDAMQVAVQLYQSLMQDTKPETQRVMSHEETLCCE